MYISRYHFEKGKKLKMALELSSLYAFGPSIIKDAKLLTKLVKCVYCWSFRLLFMLRLTKPKDIMVITVIGLKISQLP